MRQKISTASETRNINSAARPHKPVRREFLRQAGALAFLASSGLSRAGSALDAPLPNPVGYATISWTMHEFDQALATISALGYQGVQLQGGVRDAFAGDKVQQLKARLQQWRLFPTALSCLGVRIDPGKSVDAENFRGYVAFMSSLGGKFLQIVEVGRCDREYSLAEMKSMGSALNELGSRAADAGLMLGYHPHLGSLGETREGLAKVFEATDPQYVGLIADVAHLALGGSDPAEVIRTYHQRLILLHLKDARKDAYALARQNRPAVREMEPKFCEVGRGAVDFAALVATLRAVQFQGWAIVELDSFEPPPGGPAESARLNKEALHQLGFNI